VGKKGPNKVICIPSQRAEPGLITSKGYTSKKKKRNHVRTLPRCKRCAQGVWVRIRLYL
ncbi:hypothetical protein L249_5369, partial [Ophiocordyceps polyrhachis-furcata BCC 54312]